MKTNKALNIELNDNEIKAINDAKYVIRNLMLECENEFPVNDYILSIEEGWIKLEESELRVLIRCLEALAGIQTVTAVEVR